jgi:hypothetical protein
MPDLDSLSTDARSSPLQRDGPHQADRRQGLIGGTVESLAQHPSAPLRDDRSREAVNSRWKARAPQFTRPSTASIAAALPSSSRGTSGEIKLGCLPGANGVNCAHTDRRITTRARGSDCGEDLVPLNAGVECVARARAGPVGGRRRIVQLTPRIGC